MNSAMKRNITDLVVVVIVFLVSLGATGLTFKIHDPYILSSYEKRIEESRSAAAGGAALTLLQDAQLVDGVSEVYSSEDGAILVTVTSRGFESDVSLNILVTAAGTVDNIAVVSHNESPDKGGMALSDDYLGKYIGCTATDDVDAYTGASYTSEAIRDCVDRALGQYNVLNGLAYDAPEVLSNDELIALALSETIGEDNELLDVELADKVTRVYRSETGYACLVEGMGYDNDTTDALGPSPIVLLVSFDNDAMVTEITTIEQHETAGYGANAFNEYYLNMYDGYSDFIFKYSIPGVDAHVIDSQSNATGTSQSVYYLIKAATEQMKLLSAAG